MKRDLIFCKSCPNFVFNNESKLYKCSLERKGFVYYAKYTSFSVPEKCVFKLEQIVMGEK